MKANRHTESILKNLCQIKLTVYEYRVFLAWYVDSKKFNASLRTLEKRLPGIARRNIQKTLKQLEKKGILVSKGQDVDGRNRYDLGPFLQKSKGISTDASTVASLQMPGVASLQMPGVASLQMPGVASLQMPQPQKNPKRTSGSIDRSSEEPKKSTYSLTMALEDIAADIKMNRTSWMGSVKAYIESLAESYGPEVEADFDKILDFVIKRTHKDHKNGYREQLRIAHENGLLNYGTKNGSRSRLVEKKSERDQVNEALWRNISRFPTV